MKSLFEYTDKLNKPYECFFLDVKKEWLPVQPHWHYFMEILYPDYNGREIAQCYLYYGG